MLLTTSIMPLEVVGNARHAACSGYASVGGMALGPHLFLGGYAAVQGQG
jgi:hypothetical protein